MPRDLSRLVAPMATPAPTAAPARAVPPPRRAETSFPLDPPINHTRPAWLVCLTAIAQSPASVKCTTVDQTHHGLITYRRGAPCVHPRWQPACALPRCGASRNYPVDMSLLSTQPLWTPHLTTRQPHGCQQAAESHRVSCSPSSCAPPQPLFKQQQQSPPIPSVRLPRLCSELFMVIGSYPLG